MGPSAAGTGRPRRGAPIPGAGAFVNGLTLARLAAALVFPLVPRAWRLPLALAGGLSDLVDGWISRRLGVESLFGQVLDPIADKALVASILATLWYDGDLPAWQLVPVASRDLAVLAASAYALATRGRRALGKMKPNLLGKLATAGQFVFLVALLYDREAAAPAFVMAAALSLAAALSYLRLAALRSRELG